MGVIITTGARQAASSAPPFNPLTDITGWQGYYDMVDGSGVSYSVSGGVFTWIDKSGNSRDLVAPNSGQSPVYNASGINSKPTVQFVATNLYTDIHLKRADGFPSGSYTICALVKSDPWTCGSILSGTNRFLGTDLPSGGLQVKHTGAVFNPSIMAANGSNWTDPTVNKWIWNYSTQIITLVYDLPTTTATLYINGKIAATNTSMPAQTAYEMKVGWYNYDQFKGHMAFLGVTNTAISSGNRLSLEAYLKAQYIPEDIRPIYGLGDSLTAGQNATNDANANDGGYYYPNNGSLHQFMRAVNAAQPTKNIMYAQWGMGGRNTQQITADASTYIYPLAEGPLTLAPYILSWTGANFVDMLPADLYNAIKTEVAAHKATGKFAKIIKATPIPRDSTVNTTFLLSVASMMRSGMSGDLATAGCDVLCDLASRAEFDADGDYNDATYYYPVDKLHLLTAGYAKVGGYNKDDTIAAGLF